MRAELKKWMQEVPSSVTVVTVGHPEPRGATIGSFTSTSLDPPLISFNVQKHTRFHQILHQAPQFAVHLLAEHQRELAEHFARAGLSSVEQFASIPVNLTPQGLPLLKEAPHMLICVPYAFYDAGDHTIVIGEVVESIYAPSSSPLVYYRRQYHTVRAEEFISSDTP